MGRREPGGRRVRLLGAGRLRVCRSRRSAARPADRRLSVADGPARGGRRTGPGRPRVRRHLRRRPPPRGHVRRRRDGGGRAAHGRERAVRAARGGRLGRVRPHARCPVRPADRGCRDHGRRPRSPGAPRRARGGAAPGTGGRSGRGRNGAGSRDAAPSGRPRGGAGRCAARPVRGRAGAAICVGSRSGRRVRGGGTAASDSAAAATGRAEGARSPRRPRPERVRRGGDRRRGSAEGRRAAGRARREGVAAGSGGPSQPAPVRRQRHCGVHPRPAPEGRGAVHDRRLGHDRVPEERRRAQRLVPVGGAPECARWTGLRPLLPLAGLHRPTPLRPDLVRPAGRRQHPHVGRRGHRRRRSRSASESPRSRFLRSASP